MPTHPALVVIALPAGAALFGLIGLAAAVPTVILVESFAGPLTGILEVPGASRQEASSRAGWTASLNGAGVGWSCSP